MSNVLRKIRIIPSRAGTVSRCPWLAVPALDYSIQYSALWYCSGFLAYLVLAHYVREHLAWTQKKKLTVGAVCFIVGGLFTAWGSWWKAVPGVQMETPMMEWTWEFCTPNVLLATFGAFLLFTCIHKAPRWINRLAKLTFAITLYNWVQRLLVNNPNLQESCLTGVT